MIQQKMHGNDCVDSNVIDFRVSRQLYMANTSVRLSVISYSLSSNEIKGIIGRAMVQVLSRRSLAAETWVRALVSVCWIWGRRKWH